MIDFSANKHIHNTQIKHPRDTYTYEKQQIKLFHQKVSKLIQKCTNKMPSQIGLINLTTIR